MTSFEGGKELEVSTNLFRWAAENELRKENEFQRIAKKCLNEIYDLTSVLLSILDIVTDVWILYLWKHNGLTLFFGIGLTILIFAHCVYILMFLVRFKKGSIGNGNITGRGLCFSRFLLFILILLLSPFLNILMFINSKYQTYDNKKCCNCVITIKKKCQSFWNFLGFETDSFTDCERSNIEQLVALIFFKHLGFVIQSLLQSFPQCILQISALFIYGHSYNNYYYYILLISILISLINICSKLLVFSFAFDIPTFFWNWISVVTDFVKVFSVIAWIFWILSNVNSLPSSSLFILSEIYFWNVVCVTVPILVIPCITLTIFAIISARDESPNNYIILYYIFVFLAVTLGFALGTAFVCVFGTLLIEILGCTLLMLMVELIGSHRFQTEGHNQLGWTRIFEFIRAAFSESDRIVRIAMLNHQLLREGVFKDSKLKLTLRKSEIRLYRRTTLKAIKDASQYPERAYFWKTALAWPWKKRSFVFRMINSIDILDKYGIFLFYGMTLVFIVPFLLTRFFSVVFPWVCLITVYLNSDSSFQKMELQTVLTVTHFCLFCVWCLLLVPVFRNQYLMWHIAPGRTEVRFKREDKGIHVYTRWLLKYDKMMIVPIRNSLVLEKFGPDIGGIILSYFPSWIKGY